MRFFLVVGFIFCLNPIHALAQSELFAPYDCRDEVEIIKMIEMERQLKLEQARRDSIQKILDHEAFQLAEERKKFEIDTLHGWKYWTITENYSYGKNRGSLPMITDLHALHPYFRDKVYKLITQCRAKGIELAVVETYRTRAKQDEYRSMGRKYTRSGAGKSKHQYGLAVDVVPMVNGEPQWHNKILWRKIGVIGEHLGLRWGGRWRTLYDPGHFEWTGGLTSFDLSMGRMPNIPKQEIFYPCIDEDVRMLSRYWEQWESEQASYANNQP